MSEMKKLHVVSLTNSSLLFLLTAQTKYVIVSGIHYINYKCKHTDYKVLLYL